MPKKQARSKKELLLRKRLLSPITRMRALRTRRAHKSFSLTRRRDVPKRPRLPGYFSFTSSVFATIWRFRRTLTILLLLYVGAAWVLIGFTQQAQVQDLMGGLNDTTANLENNGIDAVTRVGGFFIATLGGALNASLSTEQQFYLFALYIIMILVMIWLLRQLLAGNAVRVRDALYNAGAPLISSLCIVALMFLQAFPGAFGVLVFSVATQNGILGGGAGAMLIGVAALMLVILSLYWLASSFFALLIVTIPGTYPMAAIRAAGDLALGRRLMLLLRLGWLVLLILLLWIIVLVPAIVLDQQLHVDWLPFVTMAVQVATGLSFIFIVSYIYLLFRRMIDEPIK